MSDLLREVDDEMRAENMKRLWREHGTAVIAACCALIIGTAAYSGWTNWKLDQSRKSTAEIVAATETAKPAEALTQTAKKQSGTAQAIAYLNAASLELKAGNKQKALDDYTAAADAKQADAAFRDLARLQQVSLMLDLKPESEPQDIVKDLKLVADNKNSPWQNEAIFMSAFIKGEKSKDYKNAIEDLKKLQDKNDITDSIKQRAQALQSVFELKSQEKKS